MVQTAEGQDVTAAVIEHIKNEVRRGAFVAGQRLMESDIIAATGASRGHVRESLKQLAAQGFVIITHNKGASLKRLSYDEFKQNFDAREALEGMAAGLTAESGSDESLAEIAHMQNLMNSAQKAFDGRRFGELNELWHWSIIRGARNELLIPFLERLYVPIYHHHLTSFYSAEATKASNNDHRKITKFILQRDAAGAERAMRAHVRVGRDKMLELLRAQAAASREG